MNSEYPYQIVGFLDTLPKVDEEVYGGKNGWYPQIALKRRFKVSNATPADVAARISEYCQNQKPLQVITNELIKPERMPVKVIGVEYTSQLKDFHLGLISLFGADIVSRYPERDGHNYYPHITAEYWDRLVIDVSKYTNKTVVLSQVCLLQDTENEDSRVYKYFNLGQ